MTTTKTEPERVEALAHALSAEGYVVRDALAPARSGAAAPRPQEPEVPAEPVAWRVRMSRMVPWLLQTEKSVGWTFIEPLCATAADPVAEARRSGAEWMREAILQVVHDERLAHGLQLSATSDTCLILAATIRSLILEARDYD